MAGSIAQWANGAYLLWVKRSDVVSCGDVGVLRELVYWFDRVGVSLIEQGDLRGSFL